MTGVYSSDDSISRLQSSNDELSKELASVKGELEELKRSFDAVMIERNEAKGALAAAESDKYSAIRRLKSNFAQAVLDHESGCIDGKRRFLEEAGLADYIPEMSASFTVEIKWEYGTEMEEGEMVNALENAANDLSASEVYVSCDSWDDGS